MANFLDTQRTVIETAEADRELASPVKVSYYPTTDDLAHVSEKINKSYKLQSRAKYALQGFLAINLVGLPVVLWLVDAVIFGIAVFVINIVFALIFLPAIVSSDYRRYYRTMFSRREEDICEIELSEDGISCRHAGDFSFHSWKNVRELEETKTSIYFFFEHNGIGVAKTGFAFDEQKDLFLAFAKRHVTNYTIS